ncbi:MAG: tRNA preQ1(34) S-adenosylmethionine ribosyltransferase-isomerase QueA [Sedimentisphaerales bacterium]
MKTEKLQFYLPSELIAQQPIPVRSDSRLLVINRKSCEFIDSQFNKLGDFLQPGDCLVLNDTKVLPARFFGRRNSGAKLEGLFLAESTTGIWQVLLKAARKVKTGEHIYLKNREKADFCTAEVLEKKADGRCRLKIEVEAAPEAVLNEIGFPPLPPYIRRSDDLAAAAVDKLRYQTVYARHTGAVAAPTAGLHFTDQLLERLKQKGICFAYLTLHVAAGTFKPITTENLEDHQIHPEPFSIDEQNARIINATKEAGGRIIAVGTTSTRALETAVRRRRNSRIKAVSDTTKLFIRPGYKFKIIDAMITNFHLPKSTLLALVAAFAGLENILAAYRHAVEKRYRFYSYGDAMLII